jgi:hypothetical protein
MMWQIVSNPDELNKNSVASVLSKVPELTSSSKAQFFFSTHLPEYKHLMQTKMVADCPDFNLTRKLIALASDDDYYILGK